MATSRRIALRRASGTIATLLVAGLLAAACGDDDTATTTAKGEDKGTTLVVYSGREQELVEPLYERFEQETGIKLDVRYGDSPALAAQVQEEGDRSPADVFYAQDAGAIGSLGTMLEPLADDTLESVDAKFRAEDGRWIGITGRVRALVYNTDEVTDGDLPESILDVTDAAWKDRVGVAPTNASFIAWVSALRLTSGDAAATKFLEGLVANGARTYEKNGAIVDAVAKGEVDLGLVNHYYLYEKLGQDAELPIQNHYFADGDVGNLVNVSAAGVLASSKQQEAASTFIEFLLDEGQHFIVEDAVEREYPLVQLDGLADSPRYKDLPALAGIKGPDVDLSQLGGEVAKTVELIAASGLTS
ncbi:MAG: Iron transporter substrate-binding protein [Thermoleophilia bacterium]|nr:Iron transporter substrate-binding protein [Thermoleophilia bacterium]